MALRLDRFKVVGNGLCLLVFVRLQAGWALLVYAGYGLGFMVYAVGHGFHGLTGYTGFGLKAFAGQLSVYWFFRPWFYGLCFRQVEGLVFTGFSGHGYWFWLETAGYTGF